MLEGLNRQPIPRDASLVLVPLGFDTWHIEARWQMADGRGARVPVWKAFTEAGARDKLADYQDRMANGPGIGVYAPCHMISA